MSQPETHLGTGYEEALTRASALGMRPLVAHCHLGLGKLHQSAGKEHEAKGHLATAATIYREMGMAFWLAKATGLESAHEGSP
jgi:hypothetical protein